MIIDNTEYPIEAQSPKVIPREQVQVHVPYADSDGHRGIATFDGNQFEVVDGVVRSKLEGVFNKFHTDEFTPLKEEVEANADLLSQVSDDLSDVENAAASNANDISILLRRIEQISEWDYVITALEDFTTDKLKTMSGRVLVKGVKYAGDSEGDWPYGRLDIELPTAISLIKFIDCSIFAKITGTYSTTISGFVGSLAFADAFQAFPPMLYNFGAVEFCKGGLYLSECSNIRHCSIREANGCTNLNDIYSKVEYGDGTHNSFVNCTVIDNVRISCREDEIVGGGVEFVNCSHISNVYSVYPDVPIDYYNCTFVDGDTCDGYYTEEQVGGVSLITDDGTDNTVSIDKLAELILDKIPNGDEVAY